MTREQPLASPRPRRDSSSLAPVLTGLHSLNTRAAQEPEGRREGGQEGGRLGLEMPNLLPSWWLSLPCSARPGAAGASFPSFLWGPAPGQRLMPVCYSPPKMETLLSQATFQALP